MSGKPTSTSRRSIIKAGALGAAALGGGIAISACKKGTGTAGVCALGQEDPTDHPVEPLRAGLRQVVQRHVHQEVGRGEQHRGHGRQRRHPGAEPDRRRRGVVEKRPRPVRLSVAAPGVRRRRDRSHRDLPGVRATLRQADRPGGQEHVQPQDQEVLRFLRQLRPRPDQLAQGSVRRGGRHPGQLGSDPHVRKEDQGQDRNSDRRRPGQRDRHGDGDARDPVFVRRRRAGRRGQPGHQLEADARGGEVRQGAVPGRDVARGAVVGCVVQQPRHARGQGVDGLERDLRDPRGGEQRHADPREDLAFKASARAGAPHGARARDEHLHDLEVFEEHRGRQEVPDRLRRRLPRGVPGRSVLQLPLFPQPGARPRPSWSRRIPRPIRPTNTPCSPARSTGRPTSDIPATPTPRSTRATAPGC